jgi:hypothetical protein
MGIGIKSYFFLNTNNLLELKHCHKKPSEPLVLLINGFLMYVCNKYSCIYAIVALNMQF